MFQRMVINGRDSLSSLSRFILRPPDAYTAHPAVRDHMQSYKRRWNRRLQLLTIEVARMRSDLDLSQHPPPCAAGDQVSDACRGRRIQQLQRATCRTVALVEVRVELQHTRRATRAEPEDDP